MPNRRDLTPLQQMYDHCVEAIELIEGKSREDLDSERILSLALMRLMEIVGEAAGRVSEETRSGHPEIPWSNVMGLRNRLIHGYDAVDYDILWEILDRDLPNLVNKLDAIFENDKE